MPRRALAVGRVVVGVPTEQREFNYTDQLKWGNFESPIAKSSGQCGKTILAVLPFRVVW